MKRLFLPALIVVAVLTVLFAPNLRAFFAPPPPPEPQALAEAPDQDLYWDRVHAAEAALGENRFDDAIDLARTAAGIDPAPGSAWDILQQATIALVADDYLQNLPDSRYRLGTELFLADQINGKQYVIIDVREASEFSKGHIPGAVNIPLRELMQRIDELPDARSVPMLVYCHSQKRATHALVILRELGYNNVYNLEGGYAAYTDWLATNPTPTPGPTATPTPEPSSC